jgi:hypothetical protein
MEQLIHTLLKWLLIIREYSDGQVTHHKFNRWNPVGWALLFVIALALGLQSMLRTFIGSIKVVVKH